MTESRGGMHHLTPWYFNLALLKYTCFRICLVQLVSPSHLFMSIIHSCVCALFSHRFSLFWRSPPHSQPLIANLPLSLSLSLSLSLPLSLSLSFSLSLFLSLITFLTSSPFCSSHMSLSPYLAWDGSHHCYPQKVGVHMGAKRTDMSR